MSSYIINKYKFIFTNVNDRVNEDDYINLESWLYECENEFNITGEYFKLEIKIGKADEGRVRRLLNKYNVECSISPGSF